MTISRALARALHEIESEGFATRVNLASDVRMFLRAISEEDAVLVLLEGLDSPEVVSLLLQRALALSREAPDPRYRHERDAALATYLWLFAQKNFDLGSTFAAAIVATPNCWWARRLAAEILIVPQTRNSSKDIKSDVALGSAQVEPAARSSSVPMLSLSGFVRDRSRGVALDVWTDRAVGQAA